MATKNKYDEWEYTSETDVAGIIQYMHDHYAQQNAPVATPAPPRVFDPIVIEAAQYMGVTPAEYQAKVDERIAARQAPARTGNQLSELEKQAAQWAGMTDDEYLAKRREIDAKKGR